MATVTKRSRTVFERSASVSSPSGAYTVVVSSQTSSSDTGQSQVVVSEPNGGSGLVAFDSPRISVAFLWKSDDELVIHYPNDLPPPRLDATNATFGRGGRGRVTYEAVPPSDIPLLDWSYEGELTATEETPLERGSLLATTTGQHREYFYRYVDVAEPDSSSEALQERGFHGGGPSWAGIVHGLVSLRAPKTAGRIELDPEGDGLVVRSTSRAALLTVAKLVAECKRNKTLLDAATDRATTDGQME